MFRFRVSGGMLREIFLKLKDILYCEIPKEEFKMISDDEGFYCYEIIPYTKVLKLERHKKGNCLYV